jgi:hypothetical protein
MAKAKRKDRNDMPDIDATPERIAQAVASAGGSKPYAIVDVVNSGAGERKLGKHRRFKDSRIDMLYGTWGAITWGQWFAGVWWRERVEIGLGNGRMCADYGQSMGGGSADPSPLPLSDKAERARADLHKAKQALSLADRAAIEDALDDPHPALTGRAAEARLHKWRTGLQALAVYLKVAV